MTDAPAIPELAKQTQEVSALAALADSRNSWFSGRFCLKQYSGEQSRKTQWPAHVHTQMCPHTHEHIQRLELE